MIRGLYSAATALDAAGQRQETIAGNLANVATPGYRGVGVHFEPFQNALTQVSAGITGVQPAGTFTNFQPGPIRETGHQFHLALEGDSFFALQGPNGVVYTRNGSFHLGASGQLVSDGGYPVLGANAPITIPPDSGQVTVGLDGSVSADGNPVDQFRLTRFANPGRLVSVGPTLYDAPAEAGAEPGTATVAQGYLEGANVSAAGAMVELIQTSRYFEAAQRALRAISESEQLNTRPTG
jgi:flagellar basal-body rod protein FlgF